MKIIAILEFLLRTTKNIEIKHIPSENHGNQQNFKVPFENHENHKKNGTPFENH